MAYAKPLPKIDTLNRPFWEAARQGRLVVQHCTGCGDRHFPPGPVCPVCLSDAQDWVEVSGRGTLEGWVDFHRAYWDGFKDALPYRCCLVRLEEGPVLVSNLVGDAEPRFRAKVHAVFDAVTDEVTLPKFAME
ncbi:MAG: OB-fold domain-containing protein [Rhodospirillales bacterium]|nr:OB-fold domain-containing protein [Rhodospirillales bacterium]